MSDLERRTRERGAAVDGEGGRLRFLAELHRRTPLEGERRRIAAVVCPEFAPAVNVFSPKLRGPFLCGFVRQLSGTGAQGASRRERTRSVAVALLEAATRAEELAPSAAWPEAYQFGHTEEVAAARTAAEELLALEFDDPLLATKLDEHGGRALLVQTNEAYLLSVALVRGIEAMLRERRFRGEHFPVPVESGRGRRARDRLVYANIALQPEIDADLLELGLRVALSTLPRPHPSLWRVRPWYDLGEESLDVLETRVRCAEEIAEERAVGRFAPRGRSHPFRRELAEAARAAVFRVFFLPEDPRG